MASPPADLTDLLAHHDQQHLLFGWDRLSAEDREELRRQIAAVDFPKLNLLYRQRDTSAAGLPPRSEIAPAPVLSAMAPPDVKRIGEEALRAGQVAALLVAGGQGSRLGFDQPKGMFPIGPVSNASLFRIHAEKVLAVGRRHAAAIPFLIMTSPATHADTLTYFQSENYFGLSPADVIFFKQGAMPAVELETGRVLLERPGRLFLSPNGHGGTLTALAESGVLGDLEARGVRHIFYFQVDNPLVKVCDAGFLGNHIAARSQASSKVVFKDDPGEKVGVFAAVGGRCTAIEYSDLPADMAAERGADGRLRFRAGSPAIHIFDVDFLRDVTGSNRLPYHIARKKVPHWDFGSDRAVVPTVENALKFELFVFDALPLADRWMLMETNRAEEFAPVKNATGPDSPQTARAAISRLHAKWLKASGVKVPEDETGDPTFPVEISPLYALDEEECAAKPKSLTELLGPAYLR